ncbi:uncharacterized protein EDB91DRAFT_1090418 [Suillus paluster]|uniref:uncharacterized protein n=1 Tax=Suillus paluster TaxID=48578 RepID=UPI001B880FA0|nr:uncharacterized protein EDB91DRAFT_1090418 [Suillus paluster]KAG1717973.1 hypothetical protein EDB91DRAFT_1090418 [Suillus paluster]
MAPNHRRTIRQKKAEARHDSSKFNARTIWWLSTTGYPSESTLDVAHGSSPTRLQPSHIPHFAPAGRTDVRVGGEAQIYDVAGRQLYSGPYHQYNHNNIFRASHHFNFFKFDDSTPTDRELRRVKIDGAGAAPRRDTT